MKIRNQVKKIQAIILLFIMCLVIPAGCAKKQAVEWDEDDLSNLNQFNIVSQESEIQQAEEISTEEIGTAEIATEEVSTEEVGTEEVGTEEVGTEEVSEVVEEEAGIEQDSEEVVVTEPVIENGKLIVIDAGHQTKGNSEKEPIGPGAAETKAKVTGGATGTATGQKEYELNLAVAFYLRDELQARGYRVIMVRESNDVDMSNSERAAVANNAGADAFIRIHANGSDNAEVSGTETLCQTTGNPYNAALYPASRKLSETVLAGVVAQTGFKNRGVKETDTMSGINWCNVPVTIIEMGFLSNPDEDRLMYTEEYRRKIATGIADGIDAYFVE